MSLLIKGKERETVPDTFEYQLHPRTIKYYNSEIPAASLDFSSALKTLLCRQRAENRTLVFLCIGSDRATGDCLGPILGYKLSRRSLPGCAIYGTLERPVHAKNLGEVITEIYTQNHRPFIIAIDASLGKASHVGYYTLGTGPLKPGAGVNKELPAVGDITITGIVNFSGVLDQMLLQTTRLNIVMQLADRICAGICHCLAEG